ncbi:rhodanese-like domain-containing protein [Neobacillus sp. PS3-40]|uniref:rhodanese-like domain-containing protein n=1 Tax=Neobacillus sp. PS3-40 TaxID=3070679 RepID=UPI0027E0FFD7|nr:rhodanese-like domain-containing protein [Neobacillus sp. PS3-40]WML44731.1 rhodanese-like domain-containing protein [Neobacillus sp. PS3-40]
MSAVNIVMLITLVGLLVWRLRPVKGVRNITTTELKNELGNKDKQYIDVRTPGEFKSKSIKTFKNIPLDQLSTKASSLSMEKEVVIICQSGMRSTKAAKMLKSLGFTKITNVKGGMSAWR